MTHPVALYRVFDADGCLLYVGQSQAPIARAFEHCKLKAWGLAIARIDVVWLPTRAEAEAAEVEAIQTERPIWNVKFQVGTKFRTRGVYNWDLDRDDPSTWIEAVNGQKLHHVSPSSDPTAGAS